MFSVAIVTDVLAALCNGAADGVVFEAPVVPYYATYESKGETVVVGAVFNWESSGIVFSTGRLLRKQVDEAL